MFNSQITALMDFKAGKLLSQIEFPQDLRDKLETADLPQLSKELRDYIVDVVS
ncbi:MAG: 1-deoxy-D-xylulose-5-phosphate synthase, partial [Vicingaceae bacterium]